MWTFLRAVYNAIRPSSSEAANVPLQSTKRGAMFVRGDEPCDFAAVTPNDAAAVDFPHGLWVGTGGNVTGRLKDSAGSVAIKNVASGSWVPGWWVRVDATGTTATDIVGLKE